MFFITQDITHILYVMGLEVNEITLAYVLFEITVVASSKNWTFRIAVHLIAICSYSNIENG